MKTDRDVEKLVAEDVAKSLDYSCDNHQRYTAMFDRENFVVEDDGETLVLDFEGILYESDDAVNWRIVEGANAPFKVDITRGKKFYRCVK